MAWRRGARPVPVRPSWIGAATDRTERRREKRRCRGWRLQQSSLGPPGGVRVHGGLQLDLERRKIELRVVGSERPFPIHFTVNTAVLALSGGRGE
jgi:hypothetical protein